MTDFGIAVSCTNELFTGRYATGLRVVAESVYRRLITEPGTLLHDPEYGFDIGAYLGACTSASDVGALQGLIRAELAKDERITTVDVTVTEIEGEGAERSWSVTLDVYTALGPFSLVLAVADVTVSLVGYEEAA